ncbi:MAG: WbqC family protein [Bacteroidetes bacterium]|nr:WbqC family protein [Bacteroidota bacterium]
MIVAIHQPNFFPWLGFFDKINKANIFVYLNHVENNPRTAIYTKRTKIIVNGQEHWLTCNLKSEPGKVFLPIDNMKIDNPARLRDKHIKTFELSYKKAPYFEETFGIIQEFYNHPSDLISDRNIFTIDLICKKLSIDVQKVKSSDLNIQTASNQLLIDTVSKIGGSIYMPGGGAAGYQEDQMFKDNKIGLHFQDFKHPVYSQFNTAKFIPGLSILDCLMNIGISETEILLKSGQEGQK